MSTPLDQALDSAKKFLARADRTRAEITAHLTKKQFEPQVIEQTIHSLTRYNLINEERLATRETQLTRASSTTGKHKLKEKLAKRGVPPEIIASQISEITESQELEKASLLLTKKFNSQDNPAKAGRFLIGKGFDEEIVKRALSQFFEDSELW